MSSLRRITVGIALLASVMLAPVSGASLRSQPARSFEEIIHNLKATNAGLKSFEVEQIIDVRVWFLRFRVVATMYAARPARYRVIVREGPWLLRRLGTVFEHVGAPEDLLVLYAPQAIEYTDRGGRPLLRVTVRKEDPAANPPAGEMLDRRGRVRAASQSRSLRYTAQGDEGYLRVEGASPRGGIWSQPFWVLENPR